MKFIKVIAINAVLTFLVFTIPTVKAQKALSAPKSFFIHLPQMADTKNLYIRYRITGAFGGYSNFIKTKQNVFDYEIETSYEGKAAKDLKVVIYCPGYRVKTLDIPSLAKLKNWNYEMELDTLQIVTLSGKVVLPDKQRTADLKLSVGFIPDWICEFFELFDCLLSWSEVASVDIAEDGKFSVALPDFRFDPIVSSYKKIGSFRLFVYDRKSENVLFSLKTGNDTSSGFFEIKLPFNYPPDQVFVPEPEK